MDFAVAEDGAYDSEIISLGGKIYKITPKSKGALKNFFDIKGLVHKEQYKYVLRTSQHSLSALELFAAKLGGAKVCIYRSSNSQTGSNSQLNQLIHKICLFMPRHFANVRIAPSTEAAEFMFGKDYVKKKKVNIIHNGLDINLFAFSFDARKKVREELAITEDEIVVGHVGRFNYQKNHSFLIDIFYEYNKNDPNSKLLLVGMGELEEDIKAKVDSLGLAQNVVFAGLRNNIPDILSAMDIFVFPSLYEGMPNTVIEAQASGLPCLISDTITQEANITSLVTYYSITASAKEWAELIHKSDQDRCIMGHTLCEKKYDIDSVTEVFERTVWENN